MRTKAETFEVPDADNALRRFESRLGKLVKVPKSDIKLKCKTGHPQAKRKRKS